MAQQITDERRSLLSSQARIQVPWIKVKIGTYEFGVFSRTGGKQNKDANGNYQAFNLKYPNYIQSLNIIKINGQVNQYTLTITYPVRTGDDPNFFEKVFSSVSTSRKIVFSYGDCSMPTYIYKDEEAVITKVGQTFGFGSSGSISPTITYTVSAISGAALGTSGCYTFINSGKKKPSEEIKKLFKNKRYGLQSLFTGMNLKNLDYLVPGDDKAVELMSKTNISVLDYINYLVGCMVPAGATENSVNKDIYLMTIHDDTIYDQSYNDTVSLGGPYFKVTRTSYLTEQSDAYVIDIGYNTNTIVTNFSIDNNENYSIYYDYQGKLNPEEYTRRLNDKGEWEDVYSPAITSKNDTHKTRAEDSVWWTKITKYPINASITIMGLLRPATLMSYVRLNVVFPGGRKHISSGLYLVTKQQDTISGSGYTTQLSLTKISGDNIYDGKYLG